MEKKVKLRSLFPRMDFSSPCEQTRRMEQNHVHRFPSYLHPTRTPAIRGALPLSPRDETSKFQKSSHLLKCNKYKSSKLPPAFGANG